MRDGIEVRSGGAIIKITALRDDVLRVRIAPTGEMPEDASWAVLESARHGSAKVTQEDSPDHVGFRTASIRVKIDRSTLHLQITDLNGNVLQEDADGWPVTFHGEAFRIYKKMPDDEHYFGLGDKAGPLDRRNQAFTLWNTDAYAFQESTDPIYKAIPFFLSMRAGRTLGVLLDNTWRSSFDFGKQSRGIYSFGAANGRLDYYVLYGPDPKQVLKTYAWLTGTTPLPPLWSFGYQQSRYSYETEARLREVAAKLRADKIPCDALYLDIDFQKNNRPFTVDAERFPHFGQMLAEMKAQKFHVVAITDLHIAHLPGEGYAPYESGVAGDHFVKNPDGSIYVGQVWPGPSSFPDFTRESTRKWWGTLYADFVSIGVSGFWNDMNEPSVFDTPSKTIPDDVRHRIDGDGFRPRTTTHLEVHNVYGMENSRATYEGLLKLSPEQRPFVLTRATYSGGQRYAATWTGDNSSTWNHLRLTTPMLLNLGLSGFGLTGADVGGFAGTPQPDLLTKWMELATFQPIDRNHAEKGTADREPWVHGPQQEDIRRRYIEERYRLMPYIYTTAEEMSRSGLPIVRPLFLEFPSEAFDSRPLDLDVPNEYMFGPDLLVAPPPYPEKLDNYPVKLPRGNWYDYWTGERRASAEMVHPTLEALPVFVRGGSIIPVQPLTQSTDEIPDGPLTLRVYPGQNCRGTLYQDDGKSMAYKQGEFVRVDFSCELGTSALKLHLGPHQGKYKPWWKQVRLEVALPEAGQLKIERAPGPGANAVDIGHHVFAFTVPDDGLGADVEINW
ncbi:MAG: glycoside hydrolase family 31 protein [Terriglobales bacterium]